ncbi:RHS repeat-associated core domain-containing protein [Lentisphaerota bacterium WC36G]|nr:RHS repeat-associated core domain-containing protein [Lentisphaerae bacterium WC36]
MAGAGGVGALLVVNDTTEDYYSMYDGNGNIVKYVDETSNLVASFEYTPFGAIKSASGSMVDELHYRFSTKYFDNNTNLIVYRYRNYNPQTGKWQTRDPLDEEGSLNLYVFVFNNAISDIDYLGLKVKEEEEQVNDIDDLSLIDLLEDGYEEESDCWELEMEAGAFIEPFNSSSFTRGLRTGGKKIIGKVFKTAKPYLNAAELGMYEIAKNISSDQQRRWLATYQLTIKLEFECECKNGWFGSTIYNSEKEWEEFEAFDAEDFSGFVYRRESTSGFGGVHNFPSVKEMKNKFKEHIVDRYKKAKKTCIEFCKSKKENKE